MITSVYSDDRSVSIAATLAVEQLRASSPGATGLLTMLAFFAPDATPRRMLRLGAMAAPREVRSTFADPDQLVRTLTELNNLSLVTFRGSEVHIHREVQAAARHVLTAVERGDAATAAGRMILASFPSSVRTANWDWAAQLFPHALYAIRHIEAFDGNPDVLVELRLRTTAFQIEHGQLADARASLASADLVAGRAALDTDRWGRLKRALAIVNREAGRFAQARRFMDEAVRIHSHQEVSRPGATAEASEGAGGTVPSEGEALAVADAHRATQSTAAEEIDSDDLATDYRALSLIEQACAEWSSAMGYSRTAEDMVRRLHPDTDVPELSDILDDQVSILLGVFEVDAAVASLDRSIEVNTRLGAEYADDVKLAGWVRGMLTAVDDIEENAQRIADYYRSRFGLNHPATAHGLVLLGTVLSSLGRDSDAREAYDEALAICERVLGDNHFRSAAINIDLMRLDLLAGDTVDGYERLRRGLATLVAAAEEDQAAIVHQLGLNRAFSAVAGAQIDRSILHGLQDLALEQPDIGSIGTRELQQVNMNSALIAGNRAVMDGRWYAAAIEYSRGLVWAEQTLDTIEDDTVFMAKLGFCAALAGDPTTAAQHFTDIVELWASTEGQPGVWKLLRECEFLRVDPPTWDQVEPLVHQCFRAAEERNPAMRHHASVTSLVPDGWYVKESITLLAPDGQANVIASTEPLDPSIDTARYSAVQGELLSAEFPEYRLVTEEQVTVFGDHIGVLRHFEWTPPDGVAVSQMQIYYAEKGRGYTATATTPLTNLSRVERTLVQALKGLRFSSSPDQSPGAETSEAR